MSHLKYHNNLVNLNDLFYQSHADLIKHICIELGEETRISELQEKYLDKLKLKARKDPDKPKRPKTSYMFFCQDNRKKILEDNPKILLASQSKLLGDLWKGCIAREKFEDQAQSDKTRYEEEMSEYELTLS